MASHVTGDAKKFVQLQEICRLILNRINHDEHVTLNDIKKHVVPERADKPVLDKQTQNRVLLQLTTLSIIARQSASYEDYGVIIEKLIEEDVLPLALMDYLLVENSHVSYMSLKCTLSLLHMYTSYPEPKDVVAHIAASKSYTRLKIIYDLADKLLSTCRNIAMISFTVTTVCSCWRFYLTVAADSAKKCRHKTVVALESREIDTLVSFMRLWKRIVRSKKIIQHIWQGEDTEHSHMKVPIETHDDMFKLSPQLLDVMRDTRDMYMIQNRVFDVLNSLLTCYGLNKRETAHVGNLAKATIREINKNLFDGIDFHRYVSFGWTKIMPKIPTRIHGTVINTFKRVNKFIMRKAALLVCNAGMDVLDVSSKYMAEVVEALERTSALGNQFSEIHERHEEGVLYWLKDVFGEQDDDWVQALLSLLSIAIDQRKTDYTSTPERRLVCIHTLFLHFCETIHFDPALLIDLLMSDETLFLLFFTKYLKYLIAVWDHGQDSTFTGDFSDVNTAGRTPSTKMGRDLVETVSMFSGSYSYYYGSGMHEPCSRLGINNFNVGMCSFDDTTVPSMDTSTVSLQQCSSFKGARHVLSEKADMQNVIVMFARLLKSLKKMKKSNMFLFNVQPLMKLLYRVQKVCPRVIRGYVKIRADSDSQI